MYDASYYEDRGMGPEAAGAWFERAEELLCLLPPNVTSLLDWGAGLGHLVAALRRRGLDAEGVELSSAAREMAWQRNGVRLLTQVPAGRYFDAISLYHSLEHAEDPCDLLLGLRDSLAPQGILFIEVPHVGSSDMLLARWRRQILSLPHHLVHFTPASLRRLLERSSYEVQSVNLINSRPIEAAMAWRARLARSRDAGATRPFSGVAAKPMLPPSWIRQSWRARLLPWLREALPGWRFQVLAHRA